MNTSLPSRRKRRPQKVVSDEARAAELLADLREADRSIRRETERRLELVSEATSLGLTMRTIGEAAGASPMTVSRWIRTAHEELGRSEDAE